MVPKFNNFLPDPYDCGSTNVLVLQCDVKKCCMSQSLKKWNKKDGYRQLNVRQLGSLRPWDNRGKCYMDRKRI